MVRFTDILCRNPAIKFRKGGLSHTSMAATTSAPGSTSPAQTAPQQTQAKPMSTQSIPDIDLPQRYKRRPLSEEEIAYINGGGIEIKKSEKHAAKNAITVIKVPKGVILQSGRKKEVVDLNITIGREDKKNT